MDEEKLKEEKNGKLYFILIALLLIVLLVIGISAVAVTVTKKGDKVNTITTGNISLDYTEDNNGITITNAMPTTDATGKTLSKNNEYFDFNVISTISGSANITYEISAVKSSNSTLDNNDVKLYLEKNQLGKYVEVMEPTKFKPLTSKSDIGSEKGTMILYKETVNKTTTDNYRLRMWLSDKAKVDNISRTFTVQVAIHASVKANK
ncbi:hypothetical protein EGP98_03020 [bacterium]|nr:hypothetical protein [bacterium]